MVQLPESLPARMFLLAYDLRRQKMTKRGRHLGYLLRAAALTELFLDGRLGDDKRARPRPGAPGADPYGLMAEIAEAPRRRPWKYWVRKDSRAIVGVVRDELAVAGLIRVGSRKALGLFPIEVITVEDPRVVKTLWGGASAALGGRPAAHVDGYDAAAIALAAACELNSVLPRPDRRRHRRRIAELTTRTGPAATAVRKILEDEAAAASA